MTFICREVEKHFSNDIYSRVSDYTQNMSGGEFEDFEILDIYNYGCDNVISLNPLQIQSPLFFQVGSMIH